MSLGEVPRLELDQLLLQLVDRAQDVMRTQNRLRELIAANGMIIGDLALPVVLRRIVEAACRLANARYGAIGVLAPGGGSLQEFIHVGLDEATVAEIGHLPTGKGLLGALIDDPRPIRLEHITDDMRSVGFPAHHPPMESFLGVPIRVRDEIFGNLYLSEAANGSFSADDEALVNSLAANAGVVIENARLFEESGRRLEWLRASMRISQHLLMAEGDDPLEFIAEQALQIAGADLVSVVLPTPDGSHLTVEVAVGEEADTLHGYTYPVDNTMAGIAFQTGRPVLLGDAAADGGYRVHLNQVMPIGPVMVVPLQGVQRMRGALAVGRRIGRARFDAADLDMATAFANQAAVALELADARADQQKVALLEDRDRIARDLHDHVIQRLFAAGLTLQGLAGRLDSGAADKLGRVVNEIDDTIAQVRTTIFGLRGQLGPRTGMARARVLEAVGELGELLPVEPLVRFAGPIDAVVGDELVDDIVAVVREALTNTARHSAADQVSVSMTATKEQLTLEITDNGVGIGPGQRRSGLANLGHRAEAFGGTFDFGPAPAGPSTHGEGTHLRWTIPLR
jgi:signal transduction histidine kinase